MIFSEKNKQNIKHCQDNRAAGNTTGNTAWKWEEDKVRGPCLWQTRTETMWAQQNRKLKAGLFLRLHLSLISISISSSLTPEKVLHYYSKQWPSKHKAPGECLQTLHVDKCICMQPTDAAAFRLKCRNESSPESFPPPPPHPSTAVSAHLWTFKCVCVCVCEVSLLFSPPGGRVSWLPLRHRVLSLQPLFEYLIWNSDYKKRNVPAQVKHGTGPLGQPDRTASSKCLPHLSETSCSLLGDLGGNQWSL